MHGAMPLKLIFSNTPCSQFFSEETDLGSHLGGEKPSEVSLAASAILVPERNVGPNGKKPDHQAADSMSILILSVSLLIC